ERLLAPPRHDPLPRGGAAHEGLALHVAHDRSRGSLVLGEDLRDREIHLRLVGRVVLPLVPVPVAPFRGPHRQRVVGVVVVQVDETRVDGACGVHLEAPAEVVRYRLSVRQDGADLLTVHEEATRLYDVALAVHGHDAAAEDVAPRARGSRSGYVACGTVTHPRP